MCWCISQKSTGVWPLDIHCVAVWFSVLQCVAAAHCNALHHTAVCCSGHWMYFIEWQWLLNLSPHHKQFKVASHCQRLVTLTWWKRHNSWHWIVENVTFRFLCITIQSHMSQVTVNDLWLWIVIQRKRNVTFSTIQCHELWRFQQVKVTIQSRKSSLSRIYNVHTLYTLYMYTTHMRQCLVTLNSYTKNTNFDVFAAWNHSWLFLGFLRKLAGYWMHYSVAS